MGHPGHASGVGIGASTILRVGTIFCSQINLHHCSTASNSLNEWFAAGRQTNLNAPVGENSRAKVALIQEPHVYHGQIKSLSQELKIYKGKEKAHVRACIGGILVLSSTSCPTISRNYHPLCSQKS